MTQGKAFLLFFKFCIYTRIWIVTKLICDNHFMMYVSQTIVLHTLNLYSAIVSVQLLSRAQLFETPWTEECQPPYPSSSPGICSNWCPLSRWCYPNHLILCCPLLLLISIFLSISVSNESALHIRWPKYQRFSLSISPSNEYSRLISFRIDWFDLFAVQGNLKSFLQHHSLYVNCILIKLENPKK